MISSPATRAVCLAGGVVLVVTGLPAAAYSRPARVPAGVSERVDPHGSHLTDCAKRKRKRKKRSRRGRRRAPRASRAVLDGSTAGPSSTQPPETMPATAAETGPASSAAPQEEGAPTSYVCPMHPNIQESTPSACPICGMDLEPAQTRPREPEATATATAYTCPMHPTIVEAQPSACPACGMDLVPTAAGTHASGTTRADDGHAPADATGSLGTRTSARTTHPMELSLGGIAVRTAPTGGVARRALSFGGFLAWTPLLSESTALRVGGYVRLPTSASPGGSGGHGAQVPSLLGGFSRLRHFNVAAHNQQMVYPTVVGELASKPFKVALSHTHKGDPSAEAQLFWNPAGALMIHLAGGAVAGVSTPSSMKKRRSAVNGMAGIMYADSRNHVELMYHYGRGIYDEPAPETSTDAATDHSAHEGHDMHSVTGATMPMLDLHMLMLEARRTFASAVGVGAGAMLMYNTTHGMDMAHWMTQAYAALEVVYFAPLTIQLALRADGMDMELAPLPTSNVTASLSLRIDSGIRVRFLGTGP